ncbi:MAG: hypothetical protein ACYTXE_43640 [Nostoc sp.]
MKAIKSILICAIASLTIQSTAQAQSKPEFCQIHAGNVNRYVSQSNIFNAPPSTIYRPFIQNNHAYNVTKELVAKPLFYSALPSGNIVAAFQLEGKYGNALISDKDVVTQYITMDSLGMYFQILGLCVNGTFLASPKKEVYDFYKLPRDTQYALDEAKFGILQEQSVNMFR